MSELSWFDLHPPRGLDLRAVTGVIRPLAARPVGTVLRPGPMIVFELSGSGGNDIAWRIGAAPSITTNIVTQLGAHLPGLGVHRQLPVTRASVSVAADIRTVGWSSLLRVEMASAVSAGLYGALRELHKNESATVQWVIGPSRQRSTRPAEFGWAELFGFKPLQSPDATAMRLWRAKTEEPIFAVKGRIGATSTSTARSYRIIHQLGDVLRLVNSAHASVRLTKNSVSAARKLLNPAGHPRNWSSVLSADEVASLLGWPIDLDPAALNDLPVIGGHIGRVPSPLLVAEDDEQRSVERLLGESLHPAQRGEFVRVPIATSLHHLHVIGPTGSGKSTLLASLIGADIAAGHSALVIDPKGDLVTDVLARVPEDRRDAVVVIEPSEARSIGINVLAGTRAQAEQRADQIVHLLSELHGGDLGPRSADVALHALITASRLPDGTIIDVPILLTNPAFRRRVLAQVADPITLTPWWAWFNGLSDAERGQVVAPLLNKLRAFTSRDALRRMLGQASPKYTFDDLFMGSAQRVVLINLNKGVLGAQTASLLGSLILSQAWGAIQRRAFLPSDQRHPVMVTIDEVQDYLHLPGVDLGDFFAQCRGLGVAVTAAHQHLDQLSASQRSGIMANARSRVVFRPATADAKLLAAAFGAGLDAAGLLRLHAYEACCQLLVRGQPTVPFSVCTLPLPAWSSNPTELRAASALRYGVDGNELDAQLTRRWQGEDLPSDGPIGVRRRRSS